MADGDPTTDINIVDVTMSRLRRKLKPHNIAIVTAHRLGYRLAEIPGCGFANSLPTMARMLLPSHTTRRPDRRREGRCVNYNALPVVTAGRGVKKLGRGSPIFLPQSPNQSKSARPRRPGGCEAMPSDRQGLDV